MQLQDTHIKRFIGMLDDVYARTKKIRTENITSRNYPTYFKAYRETKEFIANLETEDAELKELFEALPTLPKPGGLLFTANTILCLFHSSVTRLFSILWRIVLFLTTAPIAIPLFLATQVGIKEIEVDLLKIENASSRLACLLQSMQGSDSTGRIRTKLSEK